MTIISERLLLIQRLRHNLALAEREGDYAGAARIRRSLRLLEAQANK